MIEFIRFAHLPVEDQDRAIRFYTKKLGFVLVQDAPYQENWRWVELALPRARTHLLLTRRMEESGADVPRLVLKVDDVVSTHAALEANGVTFTQKPAEAAWNTGEMFAVLRDSESNSILIGSG